MISTTGRKICRAAVLGMSQEARDATSLLERRLDAGPLMLLGAPGPHRALLDRARRHGALEGNAGDATAPTDRVVIPMDGISPEQRRAWKAGGYELIVVLAAAADRSGQALYEAARCLGVPALRIHDPAETPEFGDARRIGLSAGLHTPMEEVEAFARRFS